MNGTVISSFRVRAVTLPRTLCWHWYLAVSMSCTGMAGSHRLMGGAAPPSDTCTSLGLHLPPCLTMPASPAACFTTESSLPPYVHITKKKVPTLPGASGNNIILKAFPSLLFMPSQVPWHCSCSQTVNRNRLKYLFLLPMPFSAFKTESELSG